MVLTPDARAPRTNGGTQVRLVATGERPIASRVHGPECHQAGPPLLLRLRPRRRRTNGEQLGPESGSVARLRHATAVTEDAEGPTAEDRPVRFRGPIQTRGRQSHATQRSLVDHLRE